MPPPRYWEKITLFVFGTFFFIVLLAIAWLDRRPSGSSWYIYICVLAMAAGGVAALFQERSMWICTPESEQAVQLLSLSWYSTSEMTEQRRRRWLRV